MFQRYRSFAAYFMKHIRRSFGNKQTRRLFGNLSTFSVTVSSVVLFTSPAVPPESRTTLVKNDTRNSHVLVQLFDKYASVEVNGVDYMTPRDFVDCVTGARLPVNARRHVIDSYAAETLLSKTSYVSSHSSGLFRKLDRNGLLSCAEFLFLVSIITHNSYDLHVLFKMFDVDLSESIEQSEFFQIIKLCNLKYQTEETKNECNAQGPTTIQRHFFGKDGNRKLTHTDFLKFISDLQTEILRADFYHLSSGKETISQLQLAQSILRYSDLPRTQKDKGLQNVAESMSFEQDSIDFDSYCAFFHLLFQCEDLHSALKMFLSSNRSISREEFQRASRAVTGMRINDAVVNTVFLLFDSDGDDHLGAEEFISVMRSCVARGTHNKNPAFQFAYWPRYVARLLRFRPVFRGDLQGWSFQMDRSMPFDLPDAKPNEYAEEPWLPVWRFSENSPWNLANRVSEFPYRTDWCVVHPDGRKTRERLDGMSADKQVFFKGDRVIVLKGPSKGKVGIVNSVIKMRNQVYVEGLNPRYRSPERTGALVFEESYLKINDEVALMDPSDNSPCDVVWRYNGQGDRVRVSKRSGHLIPLPAAARVLDDLTDPQTAEANEKDTPSEVVAKRTVDFVSSSKLETFEEELTSLYAPLDKRKRMITYWY